MTILVSEVARLNKRHAETNELFWSSLCGMRICALLASSPDNKKARRIGLLLLQGERVNSASIPHQFHFPPSPPTLYRPAPINATVSAPTRNIACNSSVQPPVLLRVMRSPM